MIKHAQKVKVLPLINVTPGENLPVILLLSETWESLPLCLSLISSNQTPSPSSSTFYEPPVRVFLVFFRMPWVSA